MQSQLTIDFTWGLNVKSLWTIHPDLCVPSRLRRTKKQLHSNVILEWIGLLQALAWVRADKSACVAQKAVQHVFR